MSATEYTNMINTLGGALNSVININQAVDVRGKINNVPN